MRRVTPYGDKCVTVVLDFTAICNRSGPSRLLKTTSIRYKLVSNTWPASQPDAGVSALKSLGWTESPILRVLPPRYDILLERAWTPDALCDSTGLLSMSAADVSNKTSLSVCGPGISRTRYAGR